jgi:NifB/MoaA-like Fe-S oxidoreductase
MPQVVGPLAAATGARFEIVAVENTLFGSSVTTAGLLPGAAFREVLSRRRDLDLALLPAEAVNDDLVFIDDVPLDALAAELQVPVRLSYDFIDVLTEPGMRKSERGTERHASRSAFRVPRLGKGER